MAANMWWKVNYMILPYVLISTTLFLRTDATSCTPVDAGTNVCGELEDIRQCILYPGSRQNCSTNNRPIKYSCYQTHKICYKIGTTCKSKCCKDWQIDTQGKCSKYIGESKDLKQDNLVVTKPTIICVAVVAIFLIFIIGLAAAFRLCRTQNRRRSRRGQRSAQRVQDTTVFSIYNNDPPPYEVVVSGQLPGYKATDQPPAYQECSQ